jgi:dihydrofolate reductase
MGRRTYESINRLLPGRTTVIVTRQRDYSVPGAIIAHSVLEALDACRGDEEIFVIGGADLFRETLPIADRIYLTTVDAEPQGDTFMPEFDVSGWSETSAQSFSADDKHAYGYRFAVLDRHRSCNTSS